MFRYTRSIRSSLWTRLLVGCLVTTLLAFPTVDIPVASAQTVSTPMPAPGTMVGFTSHHTPVLIRGVMVDPNEPFRFDFLMDTGNAMVNDDDFQEESIRLIKYFLASLTVPEDDLWVNLSPFENNRIIPEQFGITEMGRDLLAQDYLLKQLTATLMYPEKELGKKFWDKVRKKTLERFGTTDIPVKTFNKVWIVPNKAVIYEQGSSAFVVEANLKVMLEEDYLAMEQDYDAQSLSPADQQVLAQKDSKIGQVTSEIIKEVMIPAIEEEVNHGKHFAALRQIYNSLILASWYKDNIKQSLVNQLYSDQNKVDGIDIQDKKVKEKIYQQYIEAFREGVYDYIKEEFDPITQELIPRKYFSGGVKFRFKARSVIERTQDGRDFEVLGEPRLVKADFRSAKVTPGRENGVDRAMLGDESASRYDASDWVRINRSLREIQNIADQIRPIVDTPEFRDFVQEVGRIRNALREIVDAQGLSTSEERVVQLLQDYVIAEESVLRSFQEAISNTKKILYQDEYQLMDFVLFDSTDSTLQESSGQETVYDLADKFSKAIQFSGFIKSRIGRILRDEISERALQQLDLRLNAQVETFDAYYQMLDDIRNPTTVTSSSITGTESTNFPERIYTKFLLPYAEAVRQQLNPSDSSRRVSATSWDEFVPLGIEQAPAWRADPAYQDFAISSRGNTFMADIRAQIFKEALERIARGIQLPQFRDGLVLGFGENIRELEVVREQLDIDFLQGVEWVDQRVRTAADQLLSKGYSASEFNLHHADIRNLVGVIDSESVDLVYAGAISDDGSNASAQIAKEMVRVLRPGGVAVFQESNPDFLREFDLTLGALFPINNSNTYFVFIKDSAMLADQDALGAHRQYEVQGDVPLSVQIKERAFELGLSEATVNRILQAITRENLQDVRETGRSLVFELPESEYIRVNNQVLTSIRIKGVTYEGQLPIMEAYSDADNLYKQPTVNLYVDEMNMVRTRPALGAPKGGMLLQDAQIEYTAMTEAFLKGIPTAFALGLGRFDDAQMTFVDRPVGFVILAEEAGDSQRVLEQSREELNLESGLNISDIKLAQDRFGDRVKSVAKVLSDLHAAGIVHKNAHLQQFVAKDGKASIYDFETAVSDEQVSRNEFTLGVLIDFILAFYETNLLTYYGSPDVQSFYMFTSRAIGEDLFPTEKFLQGYFGTEDGVGQYKFSSIREVANAQAILDFFRNDLKSPNMVGRNLQGILTDFRASSELLNLVISRAEGIYDDLSTSFVPYTRQDLDGFNASRDALQFAAESYEDAFDQAGFDAVISRLRQTLAENATLDEDISATDLELATAQLSEFRSVFPTLTEQIVQQLNQTRDRLQDNYQGQTVAVFNPDESVRTIAAQDFLAELDRPITAIIQGITRLYNPTSDNLVQDYQNVRRGLAIALLRLEQYVKVFDDIRNPDSVDERALDTQFSDEFPRTIYSTFLIPFARTRRIRQADRRRLTGDEPIIGALTRQVEDFQRRRSEQAAIWSQLVEQINTELNGRGFFKFGLIPNPRNVNDISLDATIDIQGGHPTLYQANRLDTNRIVRGEFYVTDGKPFEIALKRPNFLIFADQLKTAFPDMVLPETDQDRWDLINDLYILSARYLTGFDPQTRTFAEDSFVDIDLRARIEGLDGQFETGRTIGQIANQNLRLLSDPQDQAMFGEVKVDVISDPEQMNQTLNRWFEQEGAKTFNRRTWDLTLGNTQGRPGLLALQDQSGELIGIAYYRDINYFFATEAEEFARTYFLDLMEIRESDQGQQYGKLILSRLAQMSLDEDLIPRKYPVVTHPIEDEDWQSDESRQVKNFYYKQGFYYLPLPDEAVLGPDTIRQQYRVVLGRQAARSLIEEVKVLENNGQLSFDFPPTGEFDPTDYAMLGDEFTWKVGDVVQNRDTLKIGTVTNIIRAKDEEETKIQIRDILTGRFETVTVSEANESYRSDRKFDERDFYQFSSADLDYFAARGYRDIRLFDGGLFMQYAQEPLVSKSIFKARDTASGLDVFVIIVDGDMEKIAEYFKDWNEPNKGIMAVFEGGRLEDGTEYMVAEYADGVSLENMAIGRALFPVSKIIASMADFFEGLSEFHEKNYFHGDLEPNNIIVDQQGALRAIDLNVDYQYVYPEFSGISLEDLPQEWRELKKLEDISDMGRNVLNLLLGGAEGYSNRYVPQEELRAVFQTITADMQDLNPIQLNILQSIVYKMLNTPLVANPKLNGQDREAIGTDYYKSSSEALEDLRNLQAIISDAAMLADSNESETGGVDFTPDKLNIEIQRDGNSSGNALLPLSPQQLNNMNIDGLYPVIINISPVSNLPLLLGIADKEESREKIGRANSKEYPPEFWGIDLSKLNLAYLDF